jgi:hypothetical protein
MLDMNGLDIQIVSDLHMEMFPSTAPRIPVNAPHIALLGDIGRGDSKEYASFVKDLSKRYSTVLIVAGNHAFYTCDYSQVREAIRELEDGLPNVIFLDRKCVELNGIKIIWCTLWSHVPPACEHVVEAALNDYMLIRTVDASGNLRPFKVKDTNAIHEIDVSFLKTEIERSRESSQKTLVLTHHAPSMIGTSDPKFDGLPTNHAFASDLSELMGDPVIAWAYGHTFQQ